MVDRLTTVLSKKENRPFLIPHWMQSGK